MKTEKLIYWLLPLLLLAWSLGWCGYLFNSLQLFANAQLPDYKAPDAITYEQAAENFYLHGMQAHLLRTPICPIVFGWPLLLNTSAHNWQLIICCLQALFWACTSLLLFYLLKQQCKTWIAAMAAVIFTLQVGLLALANELLSEVLFTALLTVFAYLLFGLIVKRRNSLLPWLGLCSAVLALTRPTFYILFLLLLQILLVFLFVPKLNGGNSRLYIKTIVVMLAPLLLHMANMKRSTGYFTLSGIGSRAYYVFMGARVACHENNGNVWLERNRRDKTIDTLPETQRQHFTDSSARAGFKHHLLHQTSTWFSVWKTNLAENGNSGSANIESLIDVSGRQADFADRKTWYAQLSQTQNTWHTRFILLSPFIWLLLLVLRKKDRLRLYGLLISLTALTIVALSAFSFWQGDRFHVVVAPLSITSFFLLLHVCFSALQKQLNSKTSSAL